MSHLTTEQFWELTHGSLDAKAKEKYLDHLKSCSACSEEYEILIKVEVDIRSLPKSEPLPGFALRVTELVRRANDLRIFSRPEFKIFRWALAVSFCLSLAIIFVLLTTTEVHIQLWNFLSNNLSENFFYYTTSIICGALIWSLDRLATKWLANK